MYGQTSSLFGSLTDFRGEAKLRLWTMTACHAASALFELQILFERPVVPLSLAQTGKLSKSVSSVTTTARIPTMITTRPFSFLL